MKRLTSSMAGMVLLMAGTPAFAFGEGDSTPVADSGDSVTMDVQVFVTAACESLATKDLDFGTTPPVNQPIDATVDIRVTCGDSVNYTVELDYGLNASGTDRQVDDAAGAQIFYDIWQPGTTDTPWGTIADNAAVDGVGTGVEQTLTANATLQMDDSYPSGQYTDAVMVSICFGGCAAP